MPLTDLATETLEAALPARAIRSYEAVVSTASAAHGWANEGAPHGAVVVADHQLSPRGHAGRTWRATPGHGLGFSVVLRPALPREREGWLYSLLLVALADVCGEGAAIEWPDRVCQDGAVVAAVAVNTRIEGGDIAWAIADVLLPDAEPPRAGLLRRVLEAIEARDEDATSSVLLDYDRLCTTLGKRVRARFRAGTGPRIDGRAISTLEDGAVLLEARGGRAVPVRPQDVRGLEEI